MDVPDLLERGLRRAPDRLAVVQDDVRRSFLDVHRRASAAVELLREAGVAPGDRVLLLAANEPEFLELQVACQRAGAVFVPANFRLSPPELAVVVADCRPTLLVHSPAFAQTAASLAVPARWSLGPGDGSGDGTVPSYPVLLAERLRAGDADVPPLVPIRGAATAQLLYTSGTTGTAKGAVTTNGALFARIASFATSFGLDEHAVFLQTLPLFHLASLVSFAHTAVGATCVTVRDPDPRGLLETIEREQVTQLLTVPTIIDALVGARRAQPSDLSSLRTVFYGASPIQPSALERALHEIGCGFTQLYGMTEAGIAVALEAADHDPVAKPELLAAAGRDLLFYRADVVRPDGTTAAPGEVGEVTLSGPALFTEYWDAPAATADVLRSGRMHTGDAGYRRPDGYLVLTDRIKDMIITGGENVSAREVETVVHGHPAVADVAVIGLPDPRWGERVHAVVVTAVDADLTASQLDHWCRERLAGYKRPKTYEFATTLPRNAVGKVVKHVMRRERTPAGHGDTARTEI